MGARLTAERPEADGVPFPLHHLEVVVERFQDVLVMKLAVIDWAASNPGAIAKAAPARPMAEPNAPKF